MKKSFWIILAFLGICLGLGIYAYASGFVGRGNSSLTAGWFEWIWGGFDCAERVARCTSNMSYCERRINEEANRCDEQYDKNLRRCNRYRETAESWLAKCPAEKTLCITRAERYRDKAGRYEGVVRERYLHLYQDYLSRCEERYNRCQTDAQRRKEEYLQRAADCRERARERKEYCKDRYIERQARIIANCTRRARLCLERLMDRCGSLVPSI